MWFFWYAVLQITILESKSIICAGYNAVMHLNTLVEEVQIRVSLPVCVCVCVCARACVWCVCCVKCECVCV